MDDPAAVLLDQAALLTAARRAGRRPGHAELLSADGPDPRPAMTRAAGRRLARMLAGDHQELLAEWLAAAAGRGLRPPAQLLPALLDRARSASMAGPGTSVLRRLVAEVGGSRVRWLAGLNQEWRFLAAEAPLAGGGAWRLGTIAQRRDYLTVLRARDPAAARELVADGWERAGVSERVMFLWVLADHLELPDEPLLEAALDDRADEVRRQAADLLARLPGSALGQRMAERALRHLRIEHDPGGRGGPRLVIVPMAESDASMRRDGITPAPDPRSPGTAGRSQFAFSRLSEIIARTPLPTWTQAFGLAAAQIITLPAGDWMPMLLASWLRAAIAQDDQEWMTALVNRAVILPPRGSVVIDLLRRLARHADPRLGAPGTLPVPDPDAPPIVRDMMTVLRFRYEMLKELGHEYGDG